MILERVRSVSDNSHQSSLSKRGRGKVWVDIHDLIELRHQAELVQRFAPRLLSSRSGSYQSHHRGRGMEFDEVRPYSAGDDVRSIDWRVTARSGKVHTKLYREERERAVILAVDLQQSMHFATKGVFKSVLAAQLAALLAWRALKQGDRLGGMVFSDDEHLEVRPQSGRAAVLSFLFQIANHGSWRGRDGAQHSTNKMEAKSEGMNSLLTRLRRVVRPGSQVTVISDFADLHEDDFHHLRELARHCDLRFISIYDRLEAKLPDPGNYMMTDGTRWLNFNTESRRVRDDYHERFVKRRNLLIEICQRYSIGLIEATSADEPLELLQQPWSVRKT
ncbi:MAG: DUF58 domain-containing protein [Gammaproteobacteria bacterium]|nr:DUF58 domain-containing protein [Gammaproteobacteria bacterium]